MKKLLQILFVFCTVQTFSQKIEVAKWNDKASHFYAGYGISILSACALDKAIENPILSSAVGLAAGVVAGIFKERIWDKQMCKGACDNNDMLYTAWGAVAGAMSVRIYFDIRENNKKQKLEYQKKYLR